MTTIWTKDDVGCYADDRDGPRQRLSDELWGLWNELPMTDRERTENPWARLHTRLTTTDEPSAVAEALDILNAHCDGVYFTFQDGDLVLREETPDA